jgi:hypothetical protein
LFRAIEHPFRASNYPDFWRRNIGISDHLLYGRLGGSYVCGSQSRRGLSCTMRRLALIIVFLCAVNALSFSEAGILVVHVKDV